MAAANPVLWFTGQKKKREKSHPMAPQRSLHFASNYNHGQPTCSFSEPLLDTTMYVCGVVVKKLLLQVTNTSKSIPSRFGTGTYYLQGTSHENMGISGFIYPLICQEMACDDRARQGCSIDIRVKGAWQIFFTTTVL